MPATTVMRNRYTPLRATEDHAIITYPSSVGGPNWGGASFIPDQHLFFVNVMNEEAILTRNAP